MLLVNDVDWAGSLRDASTTQDCLLRRPGVFRQLIEPNEASQVLPIFELSIDRDQIIDAPDLETVARVVDEGKVCCLCPTRELDGLVVHRAAIEVIALNDIEPDLAQRFGHVLGVGPRITQWRYVLVCGVTHYECDALLLRSGGDSRAPFPRLLGSSHDRQRVLRRSQRLMW